MKTVSLVAFATVLAPSLAIAGSLSETMERIEVSNPDFLFYTELEDDFSTAGTFLTEAYTAYLTTGATVPPIPVNFNRLFDRLGLNNLTTFTAVSEPREKGGFTNQAFYGFDGQPGGLFLLGGDANRPFTVQDDAPADADLVAEFSFNGLALYQLLQNIIVDIMGPMGQGIIDAQMTQRIGGTGPTFADLFNQLSTQAHLVIRTDTPDGPPLVPGVPMLNGKVALRIDNVADLFNAYAPMFQEQGIMPLGSPEEPAWKFSLPPAAGLPLTLYMNTLKETNDLLITLNEETTAWYLNGKRKSIAGSPDFIETISGLPLTGLSFWYSTERMAQFQIQSLDQQVSGSPELAPVMEVVKSFLARYTGPQVGVARIEDNAYRVISYQPGSYKTNIALAAAIMPLGILNGIAMAQELEDEMEGGDLEEEPSGEGAPPSPAN